MTALLLASLAAGASPWTLPAGGATAYGGVGVSTFDTGLSGWDRDRQVAVRVDLFGAVGLTDRLELSGGVPLVHSVVLEDPDRGPCPGTGDYCAPTTAAGVAWVEARARLTGGALPVSLGVGAWGDPWNARTRGRWTNVGQGVGGGFVSVVTGQEHEGEAVDIGGSLAASWWPTLGRQATPAVPTVPTRRAPADTVRGQIEAWGRRDALTLTLRGTVQSRVAGEAWSERWIEAWRPTADRWAVTRWGEVRAGGTVSWAIAEGWGVHLGGSRTVVAWAGPPDIWDAAVGVHRYVAPAD